MRWNQLMKEAREHKRMTQRELADILGVTEATIQSWERPHVLRPRDQETRQRLVAALHVPKLMTPRAFRKAALADVQDRWELMEGKS